MLQLRRLAPALARSAGGLRELSTTPALLQGQPKKDKKDDKDAEGFELLPPGCSMMDPTYGLDSEDNIYVADPAPARGAPSKPRKNMPPTPTSLAAAQQKLKEQQEAKQPGEEEPYVYLPPGSSMRDPGYNSMSDPSYQSRSPKVYYRDPSPTIRRK